MTVTKQQQLEWLALNIDDFFGCDVVHMSAQLIGEKRMVLDSKYHTITIEEWQHERDKMKKQSEQPARDNSWHERGELPPVGTICKMIDDKNTWLECEIIAHKNSFCIGWISSRNAPFYTDDKSEFRPLRTEREKAIEEMANLIAKSVFGSAKCQAEKLYDAGYRKVKP